MFDPKGKIFKHNGVGGVSQEFKAWNEGLLSHQEDEADEEERGKRKKKKGDGVGKQKVKGRGKTRNHFSLPHTSVMSNNQGGNHLKYSLYHTL